MSALQDQPINTSFLSPIGFKFQLNNFPEVNYFCQSATLPGISISAIDVPTPLKTIAMVGDEVTFEELSIKFIVDENMKNWLSIYDWIIGLGFPTEEGQAKYKKLSETSELTTDATLTVLNSKNIAKTEIRFHNVFPTQLGGLSYDIKASDVDYLNVQATFAYMFYEIVQISTT